MLAGAGWDIRCIAATYDASAERKHVWMVVLLCLRCSSAGAGDTRMQGPGLQ